MTRYVPVALLLCATLLLSARTVSGQGNADVFRITGPSMATLGDKAFTDLWRQADPALASQLEEALKSGSPAEGLSLNVDVSYSQINSAEYQVPVVVRIAPIKELSVGRGNRKRMDFAAVITDDPFGMTQHRLVDAVDFALDAETAKALATTPIVYQTSVILLPGRYKVRMLVRDQASGRICATEVPFTIPNLNRLKK
jgi:hypothetical protein